MDTWVGLKEDNFIALPLSTKMPLGLNLEAKLWSTESFLGVDKGYIVYIVKLYFLNLILTSIIMHLSIIDDTSTSVMFATSFGGDVTVEQKIMSTRVSLTFYLGVN